MAYVIDQPNCSCCHMCDLNCPVHAISMKGNKYWIDPEVCIDCGLCAKNCHNRAISNPNIAEPQAEKHEKIQKECDVLVIGGGGSGLVAAAKAQDLGQKVILMEKNWETGGSATFGHMMRVHYSKWHEEAGEKDRRKELLERYKEATGERGNADLVATCLKANRDLTDWLIDMGELQKGFGFGKGRHGVDLLYNYKLDYNEKRSDPSCGPGDSGWYITKLLTEIFEKKGGELLLNTRAVKLLTDGEAVVGAIGEDEGGEIEIHAKSVIVSSGTYSRNKEIMDKMQPCFYKDFDENPIHIYAASTCTGDGINLCDEIGADINYEEKRSCIFGPIHHPFSYSVLMINRYADATAILVDKYGNEINMDGINPMTEVGVLENKPGRIGWNILDQKAWEEGVQFAEDSDDPDDHMALRHLERDLNGELKDGSVIMADSIAELEEKMGIESGKLQAVISANNEKIRNGKTGLPEMPPAKGGEEPDPMMMMMAKFPKAHEMVEGPFYAIRQGCFQENAIGGMEVDGHTRVLRNGKPIPGLYATGDTTRGIMLSGDIGVMFIEGILSAMTYAMCSGYVAALEASGIPAETV